MNDSVGGEEEDSLSRKLFERTESLLGRFHHTSKKSTSREGSPDSSLLGRLQSSKQKEKPSKRQKTEAKIQGMTSPPKMQEMTSPRLKREGSKRKTKVAENIFDQNFNYNEM